MFFYRLGLFLTLVVIVFLSVFQMGTKLPYQLNKVYQKEPNGLRVFNRFYLGYLLPWIFIPLIPSTYFRAYYIIYILMFTLVMEDALYIVGLYTENNKEKFLVMLIFNIILAGLIYILILRYLTQFPLFPNLM
ncbi:MAG: hypothetical protein GX829_05365 [Clostridium sp.]|jgi:hypothetical protein|nr:hypothetical protein [Clostridium sp.]